jgi:hypothetical protein
MKSKILTHSHVVNFVGFDIPRSALHEPLEKITDTILATLNYPEFAQWKIEFDIIYGNHECIKIGTGMPSYVSELSKLIVIHIPIPTNDIVAWGVNHNQHLKIGKSEAFERKAKRLDIDFKAFDNLLDYLLDSISKAIKFTLTEGFTMNGKKIKIKAS